MAHRLRRDIRLLQAYATISSLVLVFLAASAFRQAGPSRMDELTAQRVNIVDSDGTLRLIGLLWAFLDGDHPLLLEEPELSLHSGVVRHIPAMMARAGRKAGRQIILSTHSRELLLDVGIGPEEVVLLIPSQEGTQAVLATADREIRALLEGGVPMADAVFPRTAPEQAAQLALFGT